MKKSITISEDEFRGIAAEVMCEDKAIDTIVEDNPICLLLLTMYAAKLTSYLFNKKEDK